MSDDPTKRFDEQSKATQPMLSELLEEGALEGVKVYGKAGRPPKSPATPDKRATGQIRRTNGTSTGKKKGGKK
jgi:hypothetical protein